MAFLPANFTVVPRNDHRTCAPTGDMRIESARGYRFMKAFWGTLVAVLLVVAVSGCGGGDSVWSTPTAAGRSATPAATTSPVSKATTAAAPSHAAASATVPQVAPGATKPPTAAPTTPRATSVPPTAVPPTAVPATPTKSPETIASGFAGTWNTNWGVMTCTAKGTSIHCEYTHDKGRIDASLSADRKTMEGQWSESPSYSPPNDAGRVTLTLSADGNSISGDWSYDQGASAGGWTGTRT